MAGCGLLPARIKSGETTVTGVKGAGKPASLATSNAGVSLPLPAGSVVMVTKSEAIPATSSTPAVPAKEVTEIRPAGPTEYHKTEQTVKADTGTVDTSVATHRIDVAERRWLLWAAIGLGVAGVVVRSMVPAWPSLSNGLLLGGALAFASWKLAEIPTWIWAVAIGVVALLALGYKRAEWDADHDGTPDFLQKKP